MNKNKTLSTGAFAKLCKTTKETLFHYERENLLRPKYISDKGYRYYDMEQYFDFDLITMLKETGSTLKEIRTCLQDMDSRDFLSLLETKRLAVKRERERLARREMMLQDMVTLTREALDFEYDTFMIREEAEERLEVLPTEAALVDSMPEFVARLAEYGDFYEQQKRIPRYPFGIIIYKEDVLQGQYRERSFFGRATRSTARSRLHVKPEGRYAVVAHRGTAQNHFKVFMDLLGKIKSAGLVVTGNVYAYEMMSYVLHGTDGSYALKYCVQVEMESALQKA